VTGQQSFESNWDNYYKGRSVDRDIAAYFEPDGNLRALEAVAENPMIGAGSSRSYASFFGDILWRLWEGSWWFLEGMLVFYVPGMQFAAIAIITILIPVSIYLFNVSTCGYPWDPQVVLDQVVSPYRFLA
jgi:hypothetical protein